jgi:hypothetical protein
VTSPVTFTENTFAVWEVGGKKDCFTQRKHYHLGGGGGGCDMWGCTEENVGIHVICNVYKIRSDSHYSV